MGELARKKESKNAMLWISTGADDPKVASDH
jgi:hypothetical protein